MHNLKVSLLKTVSSIFSFEHLSTGSCFFFKFYIRVFHENRQKTWNSQIDYKPKLIISQIETVKFIINQNWWGFRWGVRVTLNFVFKFLVIWIFNYFFIASKICWKRNLNPRLFCKKIKIAFNLQAVEWDKEVPLSFNNFKMCQRQHEILILNFQFFVWS